MSVRRVTVSISLAAAAAGLAVGAGAALSSHAPTRAAAPAPRAAVRALANLGRPLPAILVAHTGATVGNLTKLSSFNWSGYADNNSKGNRYTAVAGSWTVPAVTCTAEDQLTSEWVGLDGFNTKTVEQDGTTSWCYRGVAHYITWYEMYPAGSVTVGAAAKPGDHITAAVTVSGTTYTLKVTDATTPAESFTVTKSCAATTCKDASAEWIAERPAFSIGIAPLANYHSWTLTGATATSAGVARSISGYPDDQINTIDATRAYNLATAGALNTTGNGFTTTWLNSY